MLERFREHVAKSGVARARRWYVGQVLRSLVPLALASFGELGIRRWTGGVAAGILLSSFAPALVDRLVTPPALSGLSLTAWHVALSVAAALAGGFAAVRVARPQAASQIVVLLWMLYAPAVLHLVRNVGSVAHEAPWLALAVTAAATGAMLARRPIHRS